MAQSNPHQVELSILTVNSVSQEGELDAQSLIMVINLDR